MLKGRKSKILLAFSMITAFLFVLTRTIYPIAKAGALFDDYIFELFTFRNLLYFFEFGFLVFQLSSFCYSLLHRCNFYNISSSPKRVFYLTFFGALFSFGICFLTFFPGLAMSDSLVPLYKYINSDLHPLAFQIIIYQFVRNIGPSIGSGTLGFALLAIIQILLESYIVAYFMRWLTEKKAPRFLIIFSGLFLCFCPIIVCYATAVLKDSWLMFSLLLFLPNYYDFLFEEEVKPKSKFWLCVSLAMILLSRTNGIMLVIGALIPMIVWKLKSEKIFLLICILLIILINSVTSKIIESQNLGNHSFRELASIQLVQVGAAFHYEGEISNDEYEFFTKILPAEKWKENYAFSFVDYIKYSEEFNEDYFLSHQSDFTKHWWSLLIKNPDIFGRAYLYQTYGAWNISFSDPSLYAGPQSTFYSLTANCPDDIIEIVRRDYDLENIQILPDWINTLLAGYYKLGFENSMIAPGFIMLIILFISTLLIIDKKSKYILAFMPIAAGWLGFIISPPGSFIYRYYVFITISIPFILFVLFKNIKK